MSESNALESPSGNHPSVESPAGERYLALRHVMMPRDTNPQGTIFGGVLLSFIDLGGSVGALFEIRKNGWPDQSLVTVAMNSVEFHRPCFVGDLVSFWTELRKIGKTSITMHVTVEADQQGQVVKLTEADVTYVTVKTEQGQRMPVPIRGVQENPEGEAREKSGKPPQKSSFSPLW